MQVDFITCYRALRLNDLRTARMAMAIDRQQGGLEKLRSTGVSVSASIKVSQLLEYYLANRNLSLTDFDRIKRYLGVNR
ncbi:MAG: hypothetical protein US86_C0002G0111 [Candidatus Daviesbacteria bacterium GW2011_GWA2_38_24]|uniref:Uncharacterized protein n=1 Tax=Candidatus Daviesbacteria bacterium GW2011_GWA2_38_24 TaxID=1618422 RepID=A0A0G0LZZ9_9BACT|nr:MAG: hypothetical protein US86_C0002G0111 [Candidatus Daviesbacteria bacterium GW2011_GWA2_38_24]KKQ80754.1 MAG: hypothetical protein UT01_C0006G0015 [Candidatus Daviesbacteria bacterium GW2011_GWA1_38_7]